MESLPQQRRSFGCLSLKIGAVASGLLMILYSIVALGECAAVIEVLPSLHTTGITMQGLLTYTYVMVLIVNYIITLLMSSVMLVGIIKEKLHLISPWLVWTSIQMCVSAILFVFYTTLNTVNHFGEGSLLFYLVEFLGLLVRFYMLVIVASYFRQLDGDHQELTRLTEQTEKEVWYHAA